VPSWLAVAHLMHDRNEVIFTIVLILVRVTIHSALLEAWLKI